MSTDWLGYLDFNCCHFPWLGSALQHHGSFCSLEVYFPYFTIRVFPNVREVSDGGGGEFCENGRLSFGSITDPHPGEATPLAHAFELWKDFALIIESHHSQCLVATMKFSFWYWSFFSFFFLLCKHHGYKAFHDSRQAFWISIFLFLFLHLILLGTVHYDTLNGVIFFIFFYLQIEISVVCWHVCWFL